MEEEWGKILVKGIAFFRGVRKEKKKTTYITFGFGNRLTWRLFGLPHDGV